MPYSRWIHSYWYTFWVVSNSELKEEQIFDVCTVKAFTYQELTADIDNCLLKVKNSIEEEVKNKPTDADYEELRGYMKKFIKDVDKEYEDRESEFLKSR